MDTVINLLHQLSHHDSGDHTPETRTNDDNLPLAFASILEQNPSLWWIVQQFLHNTMRRVQGDQLTQSLAQAHALSSSVQSDRDEADLLLAQIV